MSLKIFSLLTAFVLSVFLFASVVSASSLTINKIVGDTQTIDDVAGTATITFDLVNIGAASTGNLWSATTANGGSATVSFDVNSIADGTSPSPSVTSSVIATITFQNLDLSSGISGTIAANGNGGSELDEDFSFTITITDTTAPVISLTGSAVVTLGIGENYTELSATASDNVDGDLSSSVVTGGDVVDTTASGIYTVTYNLGVNDSSGNSAEEVTRTVNVINYFCNAGDLEFNGAQNDSQLTLSVDINNKGEGEDNEWLPLDTIEIEVELENDKNRDLDDVVFELALYKVGSESNIIDEMMWISEDDEEVEVGDVDEDEEERHVFEFRVDPSEVEDGNYILKVKAYEDNKEDETCIDHSSDLNDFGASDFSAEIEVVTEGDEEKMVVVDTESLPKPINAFCSEEVEFTADVYNIGDQDFPDQVLVNLYNTALGIDLDELLEGDLDTGERARAQFSFNVPVDAEEKQYTLKMRVFYDYDEDDDEYKETSEEIFNAFLKVEGNCVLEEDLNATIESSDDKKADGLFSKITGSVVGMGNSDGWYLWVIGAVNVILVFSIIFVAVRMLRKS